ncbi:MAG TPA: DUF2065 domain-containing protein [Gammaproteobacteria bacterium]|nr:DUF2065 domain-containing protein [Gammaproteobacteria bacterium]
MSIAWQDVWAALALLFVFEGMMPFINPVRWKTMMQRISQQSDHSLRIMGLTSMLGGVLILYFVR